MKRNLAAWDRGLRIVIGIVLILAAVWAPLSWPLRLFALGGTGAYLIVSALAGTCVGYHLMGQSTCPVERT